jgi:type VI secretion system protein ImpG
MEIGDVETAGYFAKLLYKVSLPVSFTEHTTALWGLISLLAITHISKSRAENLLIVIRNLVTIFAANHQVLADKLIGNIADIKIDPIVQRFGTDAWRGFVKGLEISIIIKEDTSSALSFLFGNILNQYLSSIVSINSFVKLKILSATSRKSIATWNPIAGRLNLL